MKVKVPKLRRQRPIKGHPRDPMPSCVTAALHSKIDQVAREYHSSRSFVIATALHDYFTVKAVSKFYDTAQPKLRRIK